MRMSKRQRKALIENNQESKRVTREAIRDALLRLMKTGDYADIRITEIIRVSGVSRSAFYRNYRAKDDVLMDLIDEATEDYLSIAESARQGDWTKVLRIVETHADDVKLFIRAGMEHRLLDEFNKLLPPQEEDPYPNIALNGVIYATVIHWLRGDPRDDLEQTAVQIRAAVDMLTSGG